MWRNKEESAQSEFIGFLSRLLQEKFYLCLNQGKGVYRAEKLRQAIAHVFSYYLENEATHQTTMVCSLAICNLMNIDISHYLLENSSHSIYWVDIKIYQSVIAEKMNKIHQKQKFL